MSSAASLDSSTLLAVFQALPGAYLLLSPELIIEAVSEAYLVETLTERSRLVGRHLFDVFPDNPLTPQAHAVRNLRASLEQVLATGQPHQMALQHYDVPDPQQSGHFVERYWLPANTPIRDAEGRVRHLLHSVVNVTNQQRAEAQLHASQHREQAAQAEADHQRAQLARVFWQAPVAICLLNGPNFVFELANPLYQAIFPTLDLLGKPILDALPELKGHPVYQSMRQVYESGHTHEETSVCIPLARAADGVLTERYFNYMLQARYNEQGRVDGILVFGFEVTPQVQASQLLRAAIDSSTAIIQVFDAVRDETNRIVDFRWTLVNEQAAAQYDVDLVGQRLLALNPGVVDTGIFERFVQVVETGQPLAYEQEYRHEQYDGWFEQSVVRLGDGLVSTTTDITAHKQAEAALRHSEARFRALVTQAAVGIAETENERFSYVNDRFCAITGYRSEELLGKLVGDITHPDDAARDLHLLRRLYATGEPFTVDKRYVRPDGSPVWTLASVTALHDDQGRPNRGFAACIDVTDRKRAEQELQAAHARTVDILESTTNAFYALDADFRFTYINQRAAQLWGRDRDALLGRHYWTEFPAAVGSISYQQHYRALAEGQPMHFETVSPLVGIWIDASIYPGRGVACRCFFAISRPAKPASKPCAAQKSGCNRPSPLRQLASFSSTQPGAFTQPMRPSST